MVKRLINLSRSQRTKRIFWKGKLQTNYAKSLSKLCAFAGSSDRGSKKLRNLECESDMSSTDDEMENSLLQLLRKRSKNPEVRNEPNHKCSHNSLLGLIAEHNLYFLLAAFSQDICSEFVQLSVSKPEAALVKFMEFVLEASERDFIMPEVNRKPFKTGIFANTGNAKVEHVSGSRM